MHNLPPALEFIALIWNSQTLRGTAKRKHSERGGSFKGGKVGASAYAFNLCRHSYELTVTYFPPDRSSSVVLRLLSSQIKGKPRGSSILNPSDLEMSAVKF